MGLFSVTINLITIFIVFALFYIGYNIYRTRDDKNMTPVEVFNQMMFDPATVSHSYMANANLGPIGDFGDYDWESVDFITPIEE
jgi:hypothetical protein